MASYFLILQSDKQRERGCKTLYIVLTYGCSNSFIAWCECGVFKYPSNDTTPQKSYVIGAFVTILVEHEVLSESAQVFTYQSTDCNQLIPITNYTPYWVGRWEGREGKWWRDTYLLEIKKNSCNWPICILGREGRSCEKFGGYKTINWIPLP